MGRQEVALARQAYDAFNRGDIEGALEHVDPAIEWHMSSQFTRVSRVFRGHEGVREVWELFHDALEQFRAEPREIHDAGEAVIAEVAATGLVRGTSEPARYDLVHVWRIRDRRAVRLDVYATVEEARAALITSPETSSSSSSAADDGLANR